MIKRLLCVIVLSTGVNAAALFAHHSYGDLIRDQTVSLEGTIEQLTLGNPHAIVTLKTEDAKVFRLEWGNALQLQRWGVTAGMLNVGDRVVVTGSPARDPAVHRMALLTEIHRPSDGWRWNHSGVVTR